MNNLLPGLAQRLAALTRDAVQTTGSIAAITDQLPEFQPGERYTARILQSLRDGLIRADIGGQTVTVKLPEGAPLPQGSTVTLTHVERSAQTLVATLDRDAQPSAPANAAPRSDDADPVRLSTPGRTIASLLDDPPPQPPRLANGQPLLDPSRMLDPSTGVPTGNAMPQIAGRLAQAIGDSGLFYESHQAQWVAGQRPIEASAAEPQRAFDPGLPQPAAADRSAGLAPAPTGLPGAAGAIDEAPVQTPDGDGGEPPAVRGESTLRSRDDANRADNGPPAELRPLVQNQLLGLAQHTLAWEGLAWPGQPMRLEIDDPQPERGGSGEAAADDSAPEVPWTTRLRMVLPGLGEIETSLTLWNRDHALTLGIAADGDARLRMGAALLDLQQRMTDAGLRLGTVNFSDAPLPDDEAGAAA